MQSKTGGKSAGRVQSVALKLTCDLTKLSSIFLALAKESKTAFLVISLNTIRS